MLSFSGTEREICPQFDPDVLNEERLPVQGSISGTFFYFSDLFFSRHSCTLSFYTVS